METSNRLALCIAFVFVYAVDAQRQETIVVTTIKEPPYVNTKTASGGGQSVYTGYIPDLMKQLADKADFNYRLQLVEDGKYGSPNANNQWNGMIGEIMRGESRVAAAPITISDARRAVVDFTQSIMSIGTTILIKRSTSEEASINNAHDLAGQTEVQYGLVKDGTTQMFFQNSDDPTYSKMWQFMSTHPENLVVSHEEGVQKVRDGNFAFIMENSTAAYWTHQTPCELITVGGNFPGHAHHYALVVAKGDSLKNQLNSAIQELKADGELDVLQQKWWDDSTCGSAALTGPGLLILAVVLLLTQRTV